MPPRNRPTIVPVLGADDEADHEAHTLLSAAEEVSDGSGLSIDQTIARTCAADILLVPASTSI